MATHHTFITTYFDNMWDNMRVQWTQGKKKLPKVKHRLIEVKEALVATYHTFITAYFDNMWDNMRVQFFLGKKLMNIFDITLKYS